MNRILEANLNCADSQTEKQQTKPPKNYKFDSPCSLKVQKMSYKILYRK